MAGTSTPRVSRYLDAWEKAADAGVVPHAAELLPGMDVDTLPAAEEDVQHGHRLAWATYYDASKAGGRPRDSKAKDAVTIIERRGVREVLDEMPAEMAVEIAREVVRELPSVVMDDETTRIAAEQAGIRIRAAEAKATDPVGPDHEKRARRRADRALAEIYGHAALFHLAAAAREVVIAIGEIDVAGPVPNDEDRELLDRIVRLVAMYRGDDEWTDADAAFAAEFGVSIR